MTSTVGVAVGVVGVARVGPAVDVGSNVDVGASVTVPTTVGGGGSTNVPVADGVAVAVRRSGVTTDVGGVLGGVPVRVGVALGGEPVPVGVRVAVGVPEGAPVGDAVGLPVAAVGTGVPVRVALGDAVWVVLAEGEGVAVGAAVVAAPVVVGGGASGGGLACGGTYAGPSESDLMFGPIDTRPFEDGLQVATYFKLDLHRESDFQVCVTNPGSPGGVDCFSVGVLQIDWNYFEPKLQFPLVGGQEEAFVVFRFRDRDFEAPHQGAFVDRVVIHGLSDAPPPTDQALALPPPDGAVHVVRAHTYCPGGVMLSWTYQSGGGNAPSKPWSSISVATWTAPATLAAPAPYAAPHASTSAARPASVARRMWTVGRGEPGSLDIEASNRIG